MKLNKKQIAMLTYTFNTRNNTGRGFSSVFHVLVDGVEFQFARTMAMGLTRKGLMENVDSPLKFRVTSAGQAYL